MPIREHEKGGDVRKVQCDDDKLIFLHPNNHSAKMRTEGAKKYGKHIFFVYRNRRR